METLNIEIMSDEQAREEFVKAYEAVRLRLPVKPKEAVYFASLADARAVLTDRRLALLRLIRERSPSSISELSRIAGRDFKNVHTDVWFLRHLGLVRLRKSAGSSRRLSAPYRAIALRIAL